MRIVIQPNYQAAASLISQIPEEFEKSGEMIYNGRNVVKRFQTDSGEWIVKRYKKPRFLQRVIYTFFRKTKAARAYLYAQRLQDLQIDTPEGIAYIENKEKGLISDCYFISKPCNDPALFSVLIETENYNPYLASCLAAFWVELHTKGVLHGDPNLDNVLYRKNEQGGFHFTLIDTNRSVFKASLTPKECLNNLKRVTHRRDLLSYIVAEYATLRQWDVERSIKQVMKALDLHEKKMNTKRKLKRKKK